MTEQETRAILSICLMAAFADGAKDEREREQIRRVAAALGGDGAADLTAATRDTLLQKTTLEESAAALGTPELRQLAYETAVGVCDADEARSAAENDFLDRLRQALGLSPAAIEPFRAQADALAAENKQLKRKLAEAERKLEAVAEMERSLLEQAGTEAEQPPR